MFFFAKQISYFLFGYTFYKNRESRYLRTKIQALEHDIESLNRHLEQVETAGLPSGQGELAFGISNLTLAKLEQGFLPMHFPLEKEVSGVITLESFRDIHFLEGNRIRLSVQLSGENIRYEGKKGLFKFLGDSVRDLLSIRSFTAQGDCIGQLVFVKELPGIEIQLQVNRLSIPNVAPSLEELVMKHLNRELESKPQRLKIRLAPQEIEIENKKRTLL